MPLTPLLELTLRKPFRRRMSALVPLMLLTLIMCVGDKRKPVTAQPVVVWRELSDGMSGWKQIASPTDRDLYSVDFSGTGDGWSVGEDGVILRYSRGEWLAIEGPTKVTLSSVALDEDGFGWAVGSSGTILRLRDGRWQIDATGPNINLQAVGVGEDRAVLAVGIREGPGGTSAEAYSFDSVLGWQSLQFRSERATLFDLDVRRIGNWAGVGQVTSDGGQEEGYFFHTIECPSDQDTVECPVITRFGGGDDRRALKAIDRRPDGETWSVGLGGMLFHRDGRDTTTQIGDVAQVVAPQGTSIDLYGVAATSDAEMWAVGSGGYVVHEIATLGQLGRVSGITHTLRDIIVLDDGTMWAVGDSGTILYYGPVSTISLPLGLRSVVNGDDRAAQSPHSKRRK